MNIFFKIEKNKIRSSRIAFFLDNGNDFFVSMQEKISSQGLPKIFMNMYAKLSRLIIYFMLSFRLSNKIKSRYFLFVCATIFLLFFHINSIADQKMAFYVHIQPFSQAQLYINDKKIHYSVISREKTMGKLRLWITKKQAIQGFQLKIIKKQMRPQVHRIQWNADTHKQPDFTFALMNASIPVYFQSYIHTGKQPKSVTFLNNAQVVLPLLHDKYIQVVNIDSKRKHRLKVPARYPMGGFVETVIVPSRKEFWVSQMSSACVHRFSLQDLLYKGTIQTSGKWSKVLLLDQRRNRVLLSHWLSHAISEIDLTTLKETRMIRMPYNNVPRGLVLSENTGKLYIAEYYRKTKNSKYGRILSYDLEKMRYVSQFGPMGAKRHLTLFQNPLTKNEKLYVSDMLRARIEVYSLPDEKMVKKIAVDRNPNTIVLSKNQKYLFVSTRGPNNPKSYQKKGPRFGHIYVIDTATDRILYQWKTGNQPTGLDISPDGKTLVTSDFLDHAIRVFRLSPIFYQ